MNNKLIEKFAHIKVEPNGKTMEELIQYLEENWSAYRVKITEHEYYAHMKHAQDFMRDLGKDPSSVNDEIRRYHIPNKRIFLIFGMESEYITTEGGIKYYNTLAMLKGLTQEDIDTKNARWLQYMVLLDMTANWEQQEKELLEELKRQDAERAELMNSEYIVSFDEVEVDNQESGEGDE